MAGYDGSIRINTQINTQNASAQLMSLENRIIKTADKIAALRSKMDALRNTKIPTQEYQDISNQIAKAESEFNKLLEKQEQMQREGKDHGAAWERLNEKIEEVGNTIRYAQGELQDLVDTGKAFTLGSDSQEYANYEQQLGYLQNDYDVLLQRQREINERNRDTTSSFKRMGEAAKNALKKAIGAFSGLNKGTKNTSNSLKAGLKAILKYGLGMRSLYALINKLRNGIKEGLQNFAQYSSAYNSAMSALKSANTQLKNSFATAFAPIVQMVIPYLVQLIKYITKALNAVSQFMAVLSGKSTWTRAVEVQEDYAAALGATSASAKEAVKALAGFDKLNVLGKNESGGGGASGTNPEDMFEEVSFDEQQLNALTEKVEKLKDALAHLFNPFKQAWEQEGQFVIDSWKYALDEISKLLGQIGKDFLRMWDSPETVAILADILHIIGDIGLIIGHLARNFREAWAENDTGYKILCNIRDIIGVIIHYLRLAADATVEWADSLNFSPLLQAIEGFTATLIPLFDTFGQILLFLYENILLPIASWVIEEAVPAFINLLSAALGTLNEILIVLQPLAMWLWDNFLQPLGEWAGDVIIGALEIITDLLTKLGDWISEHSEAIQKFISIAAPIAGVVLLIANAGTILTAAVGALSAALAILTSPVTLIIAGIAALAAGFIYLYEQSEDFRNLIDGLGERIKALWEEHLKPVFDNLFEFFGLLGEMIMFMWEERVKPLIDWLVDVLVPTITDICEIVVQVLEDAIAFIADIINGILDVVNGVIDILLGIATGDWQRVWDGFAEVVDGVAGIIKGIINAIIGTVEGVANAVVAAVNTMIRAINTINFTVPDWIPGIGGNSVGFNIPEINKVNIPRLADGAVIRGGDPFIAELGEQPRWQTNVEAPLSTIEKAVTNAIRKNGVAGGDVNVRVYLGEKDITKAVKTEADTYFKKTGKGLFAY